MTYIILERVFNKGEYVSNKEVYRGSNRPTQKLKKHQAIMQVVPQGTHRPELGFPSAHGLGIAGDRGA